MTQAHLQHPWHCVGVWHGQEARLGVQTHVVVPVPCSRGRESCAHCQCTSTTGRLQTLPVLRKWVLANSGVLSPVHLGRFVGQYPTAVTAGQTGS